MAHDEEDGITTKLLAVDKFKNGWSALAEATHSAGLPLRVCVTGRSTCLSAIAAALEMAHRDYLLYGRSQ